MTQELWAIRDKHERLRQVCGIFWWPEELDGRPMLVSLILVFETKTVSISVEEDDSLSVATTSAPAADQELRTLDLSSFSLWRNSIGLPLLWSWVLKHQQGFQDGVQLEFSENAESEPVLL